MPKARITDRALAALKPGAILWDTDVHGLGARRRTEAGGIVFVFKCRSPVEGDGTGRGKQRFLTLGRRGRGDLGINDARKEATAHRQALRLGEDPALARDQRKAALTVAELCDLYLDALPKILVRGKQKKPSTIRGDRSNIEAHIKPLLGTMAVKAVQQANVRDAMHKIAAGRTAAPRTAGRGKSIRGGKGAATRCIGLLGGIFTYAVREGMRADNPVRGVERYADNKRERRLSDAEYAAIGAVLREAETRPFWPPAIAATRFLLLSGWRMGEALTLRWDNLDLPRRSATLAETKTGRSMRPLAKATCELLQGLPRQSTLVFPPTRGSVMSGFPGLFARLMAAAGVPKDVTPHVLRHSFASLAGDLGLSEPTIASLVGHHGGTITRRYTHLADAVLLAAADAVADATLVRIGEAKAAAAVVELRRSA